VDPTPSANHPAPVVHGLVLVISSHKVLRSFEKRFGCNNSEGIGRDRRWKESGVDLGDPGKRFVL